jgi:hypothetical protein
LHRPNIPVFHYSKDKGSETILSESWNIGKLEYWKDGKMGKLNCLLGILENWKDGKMGKANDKECGTKLPSWNVGKVERWEKQISI